MHYYLMTAAENDALVLSTIAMIIILAVIIIVNMTLWLYYKEKPKIDQGFCFSYFKLSYRRRFKRDIWGVPVVIILLILMFNTAIPISVTIMLMLSVLLLLSAIQSIYNYKMWKKNET